MRLREEDFKLVDGWWTFLGVAGVMRAASKLQESPQIRKKPSPGTRSLRVKVLSDSQKCL